VKTNGVLIELKSPCLLYIVRIQTLHCFKYIYSAMIQAL